MALYLNMYHHFFDSDLHACLITGRHLYIDVEVEEVLMKIVCT